MGRSSADIIRPNAECVDTLFEQLALADNSAESAAAADVNLKNITRTDEPRKGEITFPLAAAAPRMFAPPQAQ